MASMRDIQRRKASVQSTGQITKAMKLVSTVKLQKARSRAENAKPYFEEMYKTVHSILSKAGNIEHPYLQGGDGGKKAVIVITSNRGLAGGYNSNITKLLTNNSAFSKEDVVVYAVGKKGKETLERKGYTVAKDYSDVIEEPMYSDAMQISAEVLEAFANGEISEIYLAYTQFRNTVSHIPTMVKMLPVSKEDMANENTNVTSDMKTDNGKTGSITSSQTSSAGKEEQDAGNKGKFVPMEFETEEDEMLSLLIPKYISSLIYGGIMQAVASENGARMAAMDSATSNAEEMIADLSLKYNRARQSSITQELTEIIAGAEAIS